jgi:hypothetical protein
MTSIQHGIGIGAEGHVIEARFSKQLALKA